MRHIGLKFRMLIVGSLLFSLYAGVIGLFSVSGFPLELTVVLTGLFVVVQWVISQKMALRGSNAEEMPAKQYGWVHRFVESTSRDMGIDKPQLYIADMGMPNAFAIGRQSNGKVVVSRSLLNMLSREEAKGVVAHELAHIQNRDSIIMLLGQSIASIVGFAVYFISISSEEAGFLVGWMLSGIANFLVTLLVLAVSRQREYVADSDAADVTNNGPALASALEKIQTASKQTDSSLDTSTSALCILNTDKSLFNRLVATHPPAERRIRRLRE